MTSEACENINELCASFDTTLAIYESRNWAKTVTSEEIKIAFKLSFFIETTISTLKRKSCLEQFLETLKQWQINNNRTLHYAEDFYAIMCDHFLLKFFQTQGLNENIVDIAVRMYTSLLPKDRLKNCIKSLVMSSGCVVVLNEFVNASEIDPIEIKSREILNRWIKEIKIGHLDKIETLINDSLSNFKLEQTLPIFISILGLDIEHGIMECILHNVLQKMLDRSVLSKNFWLILLRKIPKEQLGKVCIKHKRFLECLCDFLIYVGSMMEIDQNGIWKANEDISLCPDIIYTELESIIKYLACLNGTQEYVRNRLVEATKSTDCKIWEQIRQKC